MVSLVSMVNAARSIKVKDAEPVVGRFRQLSCCPPLLLRRRQPTPRQARS
jgi:hypothetical protein